MEVILKLDSDKDLLGPGNSVKLGDKLSSKRPHKDLDLKNKK